MTGMRVVLFFLSVLVYLGLALHFQEEAVQIGKTLPTFVVILLALTVSLMITFSFGLIVLGMGFRSNDDV